MNPGERVKKIREQLNITQAEFGKPLDFKWYKIKDIEAGKIKVSPAIATKVADIYSVRFEWLLTGEGPMNKNDRPADEAPTIKKEVTAAPAQEASLGQLHQPTPAIPNFSIADDLTLAVKVLESKTHYATALHLNIRSFAGAVDDAVQLNGLASRIEELAAKIEELKDENEKLKERINKMAGRYGGCPPTALVTDHAAPTGTDDQAM